MTISGKVVVVTGGSKGIGKAIALKAAAEGANVVINYLSDVQAANNVVVEIGNDHALAFQADIAKMEEIARLIDATISRFGQIDVLIPNAAFIPNCSLRTMTEEDFDRAFAVNVKGPCFLAKQAVPHMSPGSTIIFISSDVTDSSTILPQFLLYVSTKGAMNQTVRALARDLATAGIRVNAVSPGPTGRDALYHAMDDEKVRMLASHNPFKRIGEAAEIAAVVSMLWSNDSAWVTGQILKVNGGSIL
ncbi:hypothetical protein ASPCAL14262 [Aspergillus calidoustus]|uniref:Uncharacterized protein n=1 Tax=Aspergillus calidoustus TaxID=454130 RepID=A0A0U4ZPA4_ASPCI|nr:hypothetical protein ASPCAL14262 [Aspergillus calidoustus]